MVGLTSFAHARIANTPVRARIALIFITEYSQFNQFIRDVRVHSDGWATRTRQQQWNDDRETRDEDSRTITAFLR